MISPTIYTTEFYDLKLADGAHICGPWLTFRTPTGVNIRLRSDQSRMIYLDRSGFSAKRLPDGSHLVKFGPAVEHSKFGSGQCGMCPYVYMQVLRIWPDGRSVLVGAASGRVGDIDLADMDVQFADDWNRFTVYRLTEYGTDKWISETRCWNGERYVKCAESTASKPPSPRFVEPRREY